MGLLKPYEGQICIDNKNLYFPEDSKFIQSWRASITHVPQNIYLADSSIAENIAFGKSFSEINIEEVRIAAEHAQISNYIDSLPNGYKIFVGERGIKLSGGQI